jgi:four helix bundle protein
MTQRIEKFEDLVAWQKARVLTRQVYRATAQVPFCRERSLADQLRRASVSIMANLAEGFERGGRGEFHQFLSTAKSSCAEVRSHLYVALDAGLLAGDQFCTLMEVAVEVSRIIGGLRSAVDRQRRKPPPLKSEAGS